MMDTSPRLRELFYRYLQRDIQPAEVEELVQLLGQANAEEALSGPMLALWEEFKAHPVEYPVDWERMYRQVSQVEDDLSTLKRRRGPFLRHIAWHRAGWGAVAAIFLLLAATAAYWSVRMSVKPGPDSMSVNKLITPPASDMAARVQGQGLGQTGENKKIFHLQDGSMVILNKHSTLDYTAIGATGVREVMLSGEAYFDIVHRSGQPFLVHTGKIVTRVLGTAFNVKAYPAEDSIEVTVDHGKVQVLKGRTSIGMLTDNQQIRYDKGTEDFVSKRVNVKPVIAWKPQEIVFDDITMEEAARRIGQRFNVVVSFVNPVVKDCRVTATFYLEDDLNEIMTVICGVSQSSFVINGDKIVIDGKGCN
jgi:transmembrane sensor